MFSAFRNTALAVVTSILLFGASAAQATPITYDFTVTGTTGPLTGTVAHGSFSYDSSSITPGTNGAVGLLTSLSFSWNGVTYTSTTANTGTLSFDASGNLIVALFGTDCGAGNCSVSPADNANEFTLEATPGSTSNLFIYTVPGDTNDTEAFRGTITSALVVPAPEPASLTVLAVGLAGLGMVLRTRRA